eukprot:gb/GEZN01003023.1/.p1 GENE.gb/GEZN01003023.1/~~gb/GEZN01003023.1/.p1  ORF type:complete len:606 (-),score=79.98 gb/GEZN01003023.1/:407-2224(-)
MQEDSVDQKRLLRDIPADSTPSQAGSGRLKRSKEKEYGPAALELDRPASSDVQYQLDRDVQQPFEEEDIDVDAPALYSEPDPIQLKWLSRAAYAILTIGLVAYLLAALYLDWKRALPMVITLLAIIGIYFWCELGFCTRCWHNFAGYWSRLQCEHRLPVSTGILGLVMMAASFLVLLIILIASREWLRVVSLAGVVVLTLVAYVCSVSRRDVDWRPVCWGISLQFIFGACIMRTSFGFWFFNKLGQWVGNFLDHSDYGAKFIFGDAFKDHYVAFKVLPTIIFFSAFIQMAYYLGWIQAATRHMAWLMMATMQTSPAESLSVASNIFIGMTEAMLLVRVFLPTMTCSEMHAVMVGGFSTVAGGVLAAYISFGVSAAHLISASVMSAPAAMAMAKLFYPELEKSRSRELERQKPLEFPPVEDRSLIEALTSGALLAIPLTANILALLIAFLGALSALNAVLEFFGGYINLPNLNFDTVVAVPLTPVALLLGVPSQDAYEVAKLIGQKTFLNEFVAYLSLADLIKNREQGLDGPTISIRAEVISTYALCGFANLGSIGIQIGALTPMAPNRRRDILNLVVRAMVAGTFASLLTACVAGILWDPNAKSL